MSTKISGYIAVSVLLIEVMALLVPAVNATVGYGDSGTINVYGSNAWENLTTINDKINDTSYINFSDGCWQVNVPILVNSTSATLYINDSDASCVRLNSSGAKVAYLRIDGALEINNAKITAWNFTTGTPDMSPIARSYIWINGATAKLNLSNSEINNLGRNYNSEYGVHIYQSRIVNFSNVTIDGNYIGISVQESALNASNVIIKNSTDKGIALWGWGTNANQLYINDSTVINNSLGIYNGYSNLSINNITGYRNRGRTIDISTNPGKTVQNIRIIKGNITDSGWKSPDFGIFVRGENETNPVSGLTISNLIISNSTNAAINVTFTNLVNVSSNILNPYKDDGISICDTRNSIFNDNNITVGVLEHHGSGMYFCGNTTYNISAHNNTISNIGTPTGTSSRNIHFGRSGTAGNIKIFDTILPQHTFFVEALNPPWVANLTLVWNNNQIYKIKSWCVDDSWNYTVHPTNVTILLDHPNRGSCQWTLSDYNITKLNAFIIPSSDSLDVNVTVWNTSGDHRKSWTATSTNSSITAAYAIGDFPPDRKIGIKKKGAMWNSFKSNSTGYITFIYGGEADIQFDTVFVYNVSGHIKSNFNKPIRGVTVSYHGGSATTDAAGYYLIQNIPNGTYSFSASNSEYTSDPISLTVSGQDSTLDFTVHYIPGKGGGAASPFVPTLAPTPSPQATDQIPDQTPSDIRKKISVLAGEIAIGEKPPGKAAVFWRLEAFTGAAVVAAVTFWRQEWLSGYTQGSLLVIGVLMVVLGILNGDLVYLK